MKVYQFTEQPYYPAWNDHSGSLRVNLLNRKCDPNIAADLFHRYYDEWQLSDELGLDIMLNEHHQTATCMSSTVVVGLSVLSRITKNARLLRARLSDRPPARSAARRRGAVDHRRDLARPSRHGLHQGRALRIPGLESESGRGHGPLLGSARLHHQGDDDARRDVQLGRRVFQLPAGQRLAARLAGAASADLDDDRQHHAGAAPRRARLCHGHARLRLQHAAALRRLSPRLRGEWGKAPGPDRFAYLGLVAVAKDRDEARKRGELVAGYLRSSGIVHLPFRNPPGFLSVEDNARMLRGQTPPRSYTKDRRAIDMRSASVEDLIAAGILFCGTPDEVYEQIVDFCDYCGGMGNLLMMGHAGFSPTSRPSTISRCSRARSIRGSRPGSSRTPKRWRR